MAQLNSKVQTSLLKFTLFSLMIFSSSCAMFSRSPPKEEVTPTAPVKVEATSENKSGSSQSDEVRTLIMNLNQRIDALEVKLGTLNEKLDRAKSAIPTQPVEATAVNSRGQTPVASKATSDPESGFVTDQSVAQFRHAMLLFESQKYSEAVLEFSSFLEQFADSPFAGSAQFYVGESYLKQKEYKLAYQEFQRLLTSYDRSPAVSHALREMAVAADMLHLTKEAAGLRQSLSSIFPQSPAALVIAESKPIETKVVPPATPIAPEQKEHTQ
jgi:TolA-binding protein